MKYLKNICGKNCVNTVLAALMTFAVLGLSSVVWLSRCITVSFNSDSVKNIEYKIFYTENENENFSEKHSVKINIKAGEQKVKVILPIKRLRVFRLDFGYYPQRVSVSGLKIRGMKTIRPDYKKFKMHQIDKHEVGNGGIVINSNHGDPFMVYAPKLDLSAGYKIDWCLFIILTIFPFLLFYKLAQFLLEYKIKRNASKIDIIFLSVFFILLFLPMMNISDSTASEQENRALAPKPKLLNEHKINVQYGALFEKWYNDHFMGRRELIKFYRKMNIILAPMSGNEKILVGKDGWLFFKPDRGFENYANKTELSEKDLKRGLKYLQDINDWCEKHGKKFYYFIAPDKHRIYGENYRLIKKVSSDDFGLAEQFVRYIRANSDIKVIYPREKFLQSKNDGLLYYKDDTHWSALGGYYGYNELMKVLAKDFAIEPVEINSWRDRTIEHNSSDLQKMLHSGKKEKTQYKISLYKQKAKCKYKDKYHVKKLGEVSCVNEQNKYNAYILRDSFFNTILPYLADTFKNLRMEWKQNTNNDDLQDIAKNYDLVILENVERYIPRILGQKFTKK